jgi:colanic acid/amylovoran biosynthesis glycosyltransferase
MRLAYFVNQYPKVSHTFIRREIRALEALGFEVHRYALRESAGELLVEGADVEERDRTRYIVGAGVLHLIWSMFVLALQRPAGAWRAWRTMLHINRLSHRPFVMHLASLAEAAVLARWTAAAGVQHIHTHFGTNSAEVALLARRWGSAPYSLTLHGSDEWDRPVQWCLREKVEHAAFVVCISSFTRAQLMRWIRLQDHAKLHVVHCGVDDSFLQSPVTPVRDVPQFICVGRLCNEKAQPMLIEALALLRARGLRPHLVLAGDGELRPRVQALIAQHRLTDQVTLTGWVDGERVRREILAARALVMPSCMEGLPVALIEAMTLQRPVISTYVGGIPELVRPGREGWLVEAGCAEAVAEAMLQCLQTPVQELTRMGASGRARVFERHRIADAAAQLARLFEASVADAAAARAHPSRLRRSRAASSKRPTLMRGSLKRVVSSWRHRPFCVVTALFSPSPGRAAASAALWLPFGYAKCATGRPVHCASSSIERATLAQASASSRRSSSSWPCEWLPIVTQREPASCRTSSGVRGRSGVKRGRGWPCVEATSCAATVSRALASSAFSASNRADSRSQLASPRPALSVTVPSPAAPVSSVSGALVCSAFTSASNQYGWPLCTWPVATYSVTGSASRSTIGSRCSNQPLWPSSKVSTARGRGPGPCASASSMATMSWSRRSRSTWRSKSPRRSTVQASKSSSSAPSVWYVSSATGLPRWARARSAA